MREEISEDFSKTEKANCVGALSLIFLKIKSFPQAFDLSKLAYIITIFSFNCTNKIWLVIEAEAYVLVGEHVKSMKNFFYVVINGDWY